MKEVRFKLVFDSPKEEHILRATFTEDEIKVLSRYSEQVEKIRKSKVVAEGYLSKFEIVINPGSVDNVITSDVDDEFVNSFIYLLRPLILAEEPFSFEKVCGMMGKKFANSGMRMQLKMIRNAYKHNRFTDFAQMTVDGIPVFDSDTTRIWLNAFEYHSDSEKRDALRLIEGQFSADGFRKIFVMQLIDKTKEIFRLNDLVKGIIEH